MFLTLKDDERLWCVLREDGILLSPIVKEKDCRNIYHIWKENDTNSRIFILKPVGWSVRKEK